MSSIPEATPTILFVDDEPTNRSIYSMIFRDAGYEVRCVASVSDAMKAIAEKLPDLVLLDVMLNNESGIDLLKAIKADPTLRDLYVVMITSKRTSPDEQADGLDLGADGYLTRPIEKRELLARIRAHLRHKRTVDSLRKSEKRFQRIIHKSPDGILIIDGKGRIRFVNPAAERLFRKKADELLHRTFGFPIVVGEHAEIEIVRPNGGTSVAEMRTIDLDWDETDSLLTTVRDITDRKKLELNLRASEERFRSLFEQAGDGIVVYDNEGLIVDVNGALCDLLGYSKEELRSRKFADLISSARDGDRSARQEEVLDLTRAAPFSEIRLVAKDGTARLCEVSTREIEVGGERMLCNAIIRDISERLEARAEIQRELEEKKTLLRELYHRTKNNMQVISSMLSLKKRKVGGTAAESELDDLSSRIAAMSLVHRQLYESQSLSQINLRTYFIELSQLMNQSYGQSDKKIEIETSSTDHMVSIETAVPLGQIVTELLSNSLKHGFKEEDGGHITIRLEENGPGRLSLTYQDDGVGLPPGFSIAGNSNLGLETVRLMVEDQLDGTIELLPGKGAGFRIDFLDDSCGDCPGF